jgi:hypothetical protein
MKMQRKKEAKKEKSGMGFAHESFYVGCAPLPLRQTMVWAAPIACLMLGFRRHRYQSMLNLK